MSPQYTKKLFYPHHPTICALLALLPLTLAACSIVIETAAPDSSSAANPRAEESAYRLPPSHFATGPDATALEPSVAASAPAHEHAGHAEAHPVQTPSVTIEPHEYTCPMHPAVSEHEPGECPVCGMTLVVRKPHRDGEP